MKKNIIFLLFFVTTAFSTPIDITHVKNDFRLSVISEIRISKASDKQLIFIDTTRLTESEIMKDRFGDTVFGLHEVTWVKSVPLSVYMESYLESNLGRLGSFYKKSSTVVKVFRKKEIYLFVAHEALQSNLVLEPGDIIICQNLGDLF